MFYSWNENGWKPLKTWVWKRILRENTLFSKSRRKSLKIIKREKMV